MNSRTWWTIYLVSAVLAATLLTLMASGAQAQQRTIYDRNGRAIGQETIDTQGTRTLYGSDGKAVSRESKGTIYDAESGRVLGKITRDKK
jgi:hypothetical protein